ncbi:MAG: hypothetical protein H7A23_07235 [Leptospiraceae bacterium]|nr:hypothetical protein [Leptospiraceae bacterium]
MKSKTGDSFPKTATFFVASTFVADGVSDVERVQGTTESGGSGKPSSNPPSKPPGTPIIPQEKTYLRVKVQQDQPAVTTQTEGILHFILDCADMDRYIYSSLTGKKEEGKRLDYFTLTIKEIELKPLGKEKMILPPTWSKVKMGEMNKRYTTIFNNLKIPTGEYEYIKVYLYQATPEDPKNLHTLSINENVSVLKVTNETVLEYQSSFRVEQGKLTTLFSKPSQSKITNRQTGYELDMDSAFISYSINKPIDKMIVGVKSISITKDTGEVVVLNDTPNSFDLLALHGTSVLLMANQLIPAGS